MFYQRFLILIFLPTVFLAHIESDPQTQITNDNHWIPKLKKTDLNGYSLLTRIPITKLYKFGFYRDVSVLFYYIPEDVEEAQIHFKAHEEKMNLVGNYFENSFFEGLIIFNVIFILGGACKPEDIDIHLKPFAFPVVSPQNISFPEDFINDAIRYETISLHMLSDKSNNTITLKNPLSGHWFGLAFVSWTDPQSDKIEQQGIKFIIIILG